MARIGFEVTILTITKLRKSSALSSKVPARLKSYRRPSAMSTRTEIGCSRSLSLTSGLMTSTVVSRVHWVRGDNPDHHQVAEEQRLVLEGPGALEVVSQTLGYVYEDGDRVLALSVLVDIAE